MFALGLLTHSIVHVGAKRYWSVTLCMHHFFVLSRKGFFSDGFARMGFAFEVVNGLDVHKTKLCFQKYLSYPDSPLASFLPQ